MKVCSKEMIGSALDGIEARHGCRVLFAVESGSRAWGFASPDSDYDIRGVYVRPLEWYLQLREGLPDTIVEALAQECLGGAGVRESGRAVSVALNGI